MFRCSVSDRICMRARLSSSCSCVGCSANAGGAVRPRKSSSSVMKHLAVFLVSCDLVSCEVYKAIVNVAVEPCSVPVYISFCHLILLGRFCPV